MTRRAGRFTTAVMLIVAAACRTAPEVRGPEACVAIDGSLGEDRATTGMAGEYSLTLVAETGSRAGAAAAGTLRLAHTDETHRDRTGPGAVAGRAVAPYFGSANVGLELVGAVRIGELESEDPDVPGVLWIEERSIESGRLEAITVRLGSLANRRDVQAFDGGFTALYVQEIRPDGFAGRWASGVSAREAEGYFCADRMR